MNKQNLTNQIITRLRNEHASLLREAKTSHAAATHDENIPDNKYATLGLEASYLAQGQANRAQDILRALGQFRRLSLQPFGADAPIRLTALVTLEDDAGRCKRVFIGPAAGGLRLEVAGAEVLVITPASPLGRALLGKRCGDLVTLSGGPGLDYEIIAVA